MSSAAVDMAKPCELRDCASWIELPVWRAAALCPSDHVISVIIPDLCGRGLDDLGVKG